MGILKNIKIVSDPLAMECKVIVTLNAKVPLALASTEKSLTERERQFKAGALAHAMNALQIAEQRSKFSSRAHMEADINGQIDQKRRELEKIENNLTEVGKAEPVLEGEVPGPEA